MKIITISPAALEQIKAAAVQSDAVGMALRLAAQMSPDETLEYGLGFDESKETDAIVELDGLTVVIDPEYLELLNGVHMDFVEIEAGKFEFIFLNPNDPNYKPPTEEGALDNIP